MDVLEQARRLNPRRPPPRSLEPEHPRRYRVTLGALVLSVVSFAFLETAVVPAFPSIETSLHAPARWTVWLLSAYLIVAASAAPLFGKLGDRHGKRKLLLVLLGVYLAGSIGAALAPNIWILIFFRAPQGVGGGIFPLAVSIVRDELPAEKLASGIGAMTGAFGGGMLVGFGTSGIIVDELSWRFIFVCGATLIVGAIALIALLVPPSPQTTERQLDLPGLGLLGGGLACLLVAITEAPVWSWSGLPTLAFFAGFALLVGAWVLRELRVAEPLLDLAVLADRPVLFANVASMLAGYSLFSVFVLVPHFVELPAPEGFGVGAAGAGLFLLPAAGGLAVAGPLSGIYAPRVGAKWPYSAGMASLTAGAALLAGFHSTHAIVALGVFLLGLGFGGAVGSAATLVASTVSEEETGVATSLNSDLRLMGGGVGAQLATVIVGTFTLANGTPRELGFTVAFLAATGVAALGTVAALLVPSGRG